MAQKSYALLVTILVTITLLDCFTECGAAKSKGKEKGKERKKPNPGKGKGKFREDSPAVLSTCVFAEEVNFICGSDGYVYWNQQNLECGQIVNKDLKEAADQSHCSAFPKTEEEKNELAETWKDTIKEVSEFGKETPATARKKDKNNGNKIKHNDKKDHNTKNQRRKNDPRRG